MTHSQSGSMNIAVYNLKGIGSLLGRAYSIEALNALAKVAEEQTHGGSFHGEFWGETFSGEASHQGVMEWAYQQQARNS